MNFAPPPRTLDRQMRIFFRDFILPAWQIPKAQILRNSSAPTVLPGPWGRAFPGGRITSNIAAFEARRDEAMARYRQSVLKATQEVETSLVDYAQSRIERELLAQSVASQFRAMELAKERYERGIKDFITVLDSERQLREVENSLAVNETLVMVNLISLYKALGGGWQEYGTPAETLGNQSESTPGS